ncbi:ABC transporter substrate-binding protein [Acuticoccus sp.]|uniref:ABC transporter substrate-binding protein n=1 Tax=Acuticoccus sp. TaxID=1904378 RepID=UPI003B52CCE2
MKLTGWVVAGAAAMVATSAAAQYSGEAVKVAVLEDMSGVYADLTGEGAVVAARMAVEDFGGTLNGQPIEVLSADHQNKADIAANAAREWIDEQGVDMIVGLGNSAVALAVQEVAREKGIAAINTSAATTALTNEQCSPTGVHYVYDTFALANGTGRALVRQGARTWFFITADYSFGHSLEEQTSKAVEAEGGEVIGSVRVPFPNQDFSAFLLQAQASGADVIGMANAGGDTVNTVKQASEFGITEGQSLAGLLMFITDIHALGLDVTQGLTITTAWYWDLNDETRAFADRFAAGMGRETKPNMLHAGIYSAVGTYLRAAEAAGTDDGKAVVDAMKTMTIDDMFAQGGRIREEGLHVHDMYLVEVKSPEESTGPWDYYKVLATIPGEEAFQSPDEVSCPFLDAS